jgi:hypothetical protein
MCNEVVYRMHYCTVQPYASAKQGNAQYSKSGFEGYKCFGAPMTTKFTHKKRSGGKRDGGSATRPEQTNIFKKSSEQIDAGNIGQRQQMYIVNNMCSTRENFLEI